MKVALFRTALVLSMAPGFMLGIMDGLQSNLSPSERIEFQTIEPESIGGVFDVITGILDLGGSVGLIGAFLFQRWARSLSLWFTVAFHLWQFLDTRVVTQTYRIDEVFTISSILLGVALSMMYFDRDIISKYERK